MLHDDQEDNVDRRERYSPPEVVCLGEVIKLTGGNGGPIPDGKLGGGHKDVECLADSKAPKQHNESCL